MLTRLIFRKPFQVGRAAMSMSSCCGLHYRHRIPRAQCASNRLPTSGAEQLESAASRRARSGDAALSPDPSSSVERESASEFDLVRRLPSSNARLARRSRPGPPDAGDPGRAAADRHGPRLRAEVRRHPGPGARRARRAAVPAIRLWSRLGNEKTAQFPSLVRALEPLARRSTTPLLIDGEIVALDARRPPGRVPAAAGAHPPHRRRATSSALDRTQPVAFIAFDLLRDGDEDLRGLPLTERRSALEQRLDGRALGARCASASRSPATAAPCTRARRRRAGRG